MIVGELLTQNGQTFLLSNIVIAKFISKIAAKLKGSIGLAVMVLFAYVATTSFKLSRIQREPCL